MCDYYKDKDIQNINTEKLLDKIWVLRDKDKYSQILKNIYFFQDKVKVEKNEFSDEIKKIIEYMDDNSDKKKYEKSK